MLVVTAPGSGAEIIPFLKTWVNLPAAIAFTIGYAQVRLVVPTEGYTTWSGLVQTLHRQLVMTRGVSQSVRHGDVITCQIHPLRFASCCATGTRDKFIRACAAFQHADAAPALLRVHHPFHHVLRMFRVLHVPQHRGPPPHSCAPTQACPTVRTVFPFMCVGMCTERHFGRTDTPNTLVMLASEGLLPL